MNTGNYKLLNSTWHTKGNKYIPKEIFYNNLSAPKYIHSYLHNSRNRIKLI